MQLKILNKLKAHVAWSALFDKVSNLFRNIKIQYRLIISFMLVSLIPLTFTGVIASIQSSGAIENKIGTYSAQICSDISKIINTQTDTLEVVQKDISYNKVLQDGMENLETMDDLSRVEFLQNLNDLILSRKTIHKEISGIEMLDANRKQLMFCGKTVSMSSEAMDSVARQCDSQLGKAVWRIVENTTGSNERYFALSAAINSVNSSKCIGYILIYIKSDYFSSMLSDIDVGKGSDIFLIDESGVLFAEKMSKVSVGSPFGEKSVIASIKEKKQAFSADINRQKHLVTYSDVPGKTWWVAVAVPYSYLNMETDAIRNVILIVALVCFAAAILLAVVITKSVTLPLRNLVNIMTIARNGDLSVKAEDKKADEIAAVISIFNDMIGNIRNLIAQVNRCALDVLKSSGEITCVAESTHKNSEQVALIVQDIAKGAVSQADEISREVDQFETLSNKINNVGQEIGNVAGVVNDTKQLSQVAMQMVETLNARTVETKNISLKITEDIYGLNSDMKQIQSIVKVIAGISEQTNLLALNAAIEAARAGSAGRGFAVVADEVKKLADQSKESSVSINEIIKSIMRKTEITVGAANEAGTTIEKQIGAMQETDKSFRTIYSSMDDISRHINIVKYDLQGVIDSKSKALEGIESISAVATQSAATSEEVSASTEEQMADSETLMNLALKLKDMSSELEKSVSSFKV